MTPLKLIRSIGKLVRGGAGPSQIFLGAVLGVLIGMNPGFNLLLVLGIVLFLILNAHFGVTLLGFALGKALCYLLAPLTYRIGYFLIHDIGLEGLFAWLASTPVLALMNLDVYCLVGGLLPGLIIGCLLGWAMVRVVVSVRKGLIAAQDRSERARKAGGNAFVRVLLRVLFGKQKKSLIESLESRPPLLRKGGLILTAVLIVLVVAAELILVGYYLEGAVKSAMERAAGAEVNLEDAELSLLSGSVRLEGLQVTDRDKPTHNAFQAQALEGNLSISDLLARRVVVSKLEGRRVRTDVKRDSPGEVFPREVPEEEEAPPEAPPEEETPGPRLERYFETAREYKDKLQQLREFLENRRKDVEERAPEEVRPDQPLLRLSASELVTRRPDWIIRSLEVLDIAPAEDGPSYDLVGREISSMPALNPEPMEVRLTGEEGLEAKVKFDFSAPDSMHHVRLVLPEVELGEEFPVQVSDGTVPLTLEGRFNASRIDVPFEIPIRAGQARTREGEGLFSLDASTTQQLLSAVSEWSIYGRIEGDLDSPRVRFDEERTLNSLKKATRAAATRKAEEAVEKLEEETGVKVPEELKSKGLDSLEGLFRRKDDD